MKKTKRPGRFWICRCGTIPEEITTSDDDNDQVITIRHEPQSQAPSVETMVSSQIAKNNKHDLNPQVLEGLIPTAQSVIREFWKTRYESCNDHDRQLLYDIIKESSSHSKSSQNDNTLTIRVDNKSISTAIVNFIGELNHKSLNITGISFADCGIQTQTLCSRLGTEMRRGSGLKTLNLSGNPMNNKSIEQIVRYLAQNESLEELRLRKVGLTEEGICNISNSLLLSGNRTLKILDLSDNNLNNRSLESIARCCKWNTSIVNLDVGMNGGFPPVLHQSTHLGRRFSSSSSNNNTSKENIVPEVEYLSAEQSMESIAIVSERNDCIAQVIHDILDRWDHAVSSTTDAKNLDATAVACDLFDLQDWFAYADTRGKRKTMEDMMLMRTNFMAYEFVHIFGVFDGHGGTQCTRFVQTNFLELLTESLLSLGVHPCNATGQVDAASKTIDPDIMIHALADAFSALQHRCRLFRIKNGTCVLVAVLLGDRLVISTIGDSQAISITNSGAATLSVIVRPHDSEERRRIESCGGFVADNGRLCGMLAVSRALGDIEFTDFLSSEPISRRFQIMEDDRWLVMACDGVWDVLDGEQIFKLLYYVNEPMRAAHVIREAATVNGSSDNITVVCIALHRYRKKVFC